MSKDDAYAEFKDKFKDDPDILQNVEPGSLPASYKATVADSALAEPIQTVLAALSGVDEVGVLGTTAKAYMATQGVIVQVSRTLTDAQRTGIVQAIKALPKSC